jgi:hypothetical protein
MVTATPDASSLAEVLDRILDKGIVVDVWARISLVGIEILTVEARVVVASVDTFLHYSEEMAKIEQALIRSNRTITSAVPWSRSVASWIWLQRI